MEENTLYQGGNEQGAADPVATEENTGVDTETGEKGQEVADPVNTETAEGKTQTQSAEANAAFAQIRRRAESAERQAAEERAKAERMTQILSGLGFQGQTGEEISDSAMSHMTGKPVEEIRREREAFSRQNAQTQALIAEVEALRDKEAQRVMEDDLKVFQKIDPSLKSMDDVNPLYFQMLTSSGENGKDPQFREALFRTVAGMQEGKKIQPPPKIGKVNTKTEVQKEYYSEKELDNLSAADLDDPKIRAKAIKSLTKLGKM